MASIDSQGIAYVCGLDDASSDQIQPKCLAYRSGSAEPEWEIELPGSMAEVGAVALAEGRLYVVTKDGHFYAIGEASDAPEVSVQAGGTSQAVSGETQVESATEQPPAAAGLVWSTPLPGVIGGSLSEQEDGSFLALTTSKVRSQTK
jgi:hypothetical protein